MSKTTETSKFLSYVLRHEPQAIGLSLDAEGWADIAELIELANQSGKEIDRELLQHVVDTSDKKRFTISADGSRIRAAQGHSTTEVKISYEQKLPPDILYHGTATRFVESIQQQGLIAGQRHHVHLSELVSTAVDVGKRYGTPHIFVVNAKQMAVDGFAFYQSENNVWLTEKVPVQYLTDYQVK